MKLVLLLSALAAAPTAPGAPGLQTLAEEVVAQAARHGGQGTLAVAVGSPESPELAQAAQTAVVAAATGRFRAVLVLPGAGFGAEEAARTNGADFLLRLIARVQGAEATLAGDLVPTWVNFWAGADPVRPAGGAAVAARAPADAQLAVLSRQAKPGLEVATRFALRPLVRLPERVLAVAVGDLDGDGTSEVALLAGTVVVVLDAAGRPRARRDLSALPRALRPARDPVGTLCLRPAAASEPGKEPSRAQLLALPAGRARGEALELQGSELKLVHALDATPPAFGAQGALQALPVEGKNVFGPELRLGSRAVRLSFSPLTLSANGRPGAPAVLAISAEGAAVLLDSELRSTDLTGPGALGAAAALADVDGDGGAELVTTLPVRQDDRVRLARADGRTVLFESEALPLNLLAAAAGDLDGDGREEVILAGWTADGGTQLLVLGAQR